MRKFILKDSPHQKLFWIAIIIMTIAGVLMFAKQIAGI